VESLPGAWLISRPHLQILDIGGKSYWGQYYKLLTTVIVAVSYEARVFATAIYFHPSMIFEGRTGAYQWNFI
jgi:hypothetical protein